MHNAGRGNMLDPAVLLQQLAESASAKEHARRELQRELKQVELELQALTQSPSTSPPRRQRPRPTTWTANTTLHFEPIGGRRVKHSTDDSVSTESQSESAAKRSARPKTTTAISQKRAVPKPTSPSKLTPSTEPIKTKIVSSPTKLPAMPSPSKAKRPTSVGVAQGSPVDSLKKSHRSNSLEALQAIGVVKATVAGYEVERGVDTKFIMQAKELADGDPDKLGALLATPTMVRALERTGLVCGILLPRTLEQCLVDETHPLRVKVPIETARRKLAQHEERRVEHLARLLEEHAVVQLIEAQEREAANEQSRMEKELNEAVAAEEKRIATIKRRADAKQRVQDIQNDQLRARREMLQDRAAARQELFKIKQQEEIKQGAARRAKAFADSEARKQRLKANKDSRNAGRHARFEKREADFLLRTKQRKDAQNAKEAAKRAMLQTRLMQRQAVIESQRQERAMATMRLHAKLSKRNDQIEQQVKERKLALEIAKLEKRDARDLKRANVERSKRRHDFKREQSRLKLKEKSDVAKKRTELKDALTNVRRTAAAKELILLHRRREADSKTERHSSPGPGQYSLPSTLRGGGLSLPTGGASYLEQLMKRAAEEPGPGARQNITWQGSSGGTFNLSQPKSDIEIKMYNASQLPAPGENQDISFQQKTGGAFNLSRKLNDVESAGPGPGDYDVPSDFKAAAKRIDQVSLWIFDGWN
eukprot:g2330.t1